MGRFAMLVAAFELFPAPMPASWSHGEAKSTPGRIRTYNLRFRRPMLYPIELRAPVYISL